MGEWFVQINYTDTMDGHSYTKIVKKPANTFGTNMVLNDVSSENNSQPTNINIVKGTEIKTNDYFDLNGRRLNGEPTQKGVYIHDGKKIIVK